eukprot:1194584-Prorocentrum_minimum.AAC.5
MCEYPCRTGCDVYGADGRCEKASGGGGGGVYQLLGRGPCRTRVLGVGYVSPPERDQIPNLRPPAAVSDPRRFRAEWSVSEATAGFLEGCARSKRLECTGALSEGLGAAIALNRGSGVVVVTSRWAREYLTELSGTTNL